MAKKAKIYVEKGSELSVEEQEQIQEGLDWLRNWLDKRQKADMLNGGETEEDVQNAFQKLDEMQIYVGKNGINTMLECLDNGTLHLSDEFLKEYDGNYDKALSDFKKSCLSVEMADQGIALTVARYVKEPAIFVNTDLLRANDERAGISTLKSIITHEATHVIGFTKSENESNVIKLDEKGRYVISDEYWDYNNEVYARVMQMRQELNLDPTETYILDDIKEMRQKCENRENFKYDKNNPNKKMDWQFFERYTDVQIQFYLNDTSDNGKQQSDYGFGTDNKDLASVMKKDAKDAQMKQSCMKEMAALNRQKDEKKAPDKEASTSSEKQISPAQYKAMSEGKDIS